MSCFKKIIWVAALGAVFSSTAAAQVIFNEPFNEANTSVTGVDNAGGVSWNTVCPTCLAGDHFYVNAGQLEGNDTNGPATWETGLIDISTCGFIDIAFTISESGTMEACGTGCNSTDWIQLEYNIDGSGWQSPGNSFLCTGSCANINVIHGDDIPGGTMNYSSGCIPGGNTLQFRITVQAWASDEFWRVDNISVSCSPSSDPTISPAGPFCVTAAPFQLTAASPGGTWSGTGVSAGGLFNPATAGVGNHLITYTTGIAPCTATDTETFVVISSPTVNAPANQALCANALTTSVNFSGTAGAAFNWTNNNPSIGLAAGGSGDIPPFTALNATPGSTVTATVTVTPSLGGCSGTPQNFIFSVSNPVPSITAPANLTAFCSIAEQPVYGSFAAFTGAGGTASATGGTIQPATFTLVSEVSDGNSCPEIVTRTYSIDDNCGNTATCTQTITIHDTVDPTASNPAPLHVQCIGDVPSANPLVVIDEADNCGAPVVVFVSDVSDGGTCPEIIARTYSVTDACGNSIHVIQTITVEDTTVPTAAAPAAINLLTGPAPAPDATVITGEADNCSVPVVVFVSDVSDGNACPETITRTYSVTDDCGNFIHVAQLILIGDPVPPTASNPAPIHVECIGDVPVADPFVVTDEADNDGAPVVTFVSDVSDGNTCPETLTRTYAVTDNCGNSITVTQTIVVQDLTYPTASDLTAVTVQSVNDVPAAAPAVVTDEADNCGATFVAFVGDVSDGGTNPEIITRTYSVADACGNLIYVTQLITVIDTVVVIPPPVPEELLFYVPNTFTPNGDGHNPVFQPVFTSGFDAYDFHLLIFNRWGEVVFESYDATAGWNGSYADAGPAEGGVYAWRIEFGVPASDKRLEYTGHVLLLE